MNELEQLQELFKQGKATPQQIVRLKELSSSNSTSQPGEPTREEVLQKGEYNSQTGEYCYDGKCYEGTTDRALFEDAVYGLKKDPRFNTSDGTIDFAELSPEKIGKIIRMGTAIRGEDLSKENVDAFANTFYEFNRANQATFGVDKLPIEESKFQESWTDFENQYARTIKDKFGNDIPMSISETGQYKTYNNKNIPKESMPGYKGPDTRFDNVPLLSNLSKVDNTSLPSGLQQASQSTPTVSIPTQKVNQVTLSVKSPQKSDEATQVYYDQNSGQWKPIEPNNKFDLSNIFGGNTPKKSAPSNAVNSIGEIPMSPAGSDWSNLSNPDVSPVTPSWSTQKNPNAVDLTDPSKMSLIGPHAWQPGPSYEGSDSEGSGGQDFQGQQGQFAFPYINPGGSDVSTELYTLGRSLGAPKGSKGKLLTGIAAGGAALMDIGRNVASGIGYEKRNQYVNDWYRKQQQKTNYNSDSQTDDTNTVGGPTQSRDGGMFGSYGLFMEDGGDMQMPQGQPEQAQSQEVDGQMQQPQEGDQNQAMQQVAQAVSQMLQQGAKPEQIIQTLVQQGIPQEQATQIVQSVIQQMQGGQQQQQPQQSTMKNGGLFDKKPGDPITFKHKGKTIKGVIKEIKNGQVILK